MRGHQLTARHHRDEQALAQHSDEEEKAGEEEQGGAAADGHVEDHRADCDHQEELQHAEAEIGQKLAEHNLQAAHRRGKKLFHGPAFPFPGHRERGQQHGGDGEQIHGQAGDHEQGRAGLGVEQGEHLHLQGRLGGEVDAAQALGAHQAVDLAQDLVGHHAVSTVDDELDLAVAAGGQLAFDSPREWPARPGPGPGESCAGPWPRRCRPRL